MKKNKFQSFGVMIDMSRNAVMNLPALKNFMTILKKMGYNTVMLYTEDTYEVEGEPYFGYMRGRYSVAEMQEIDEFAQSLGIEVIPCIQALAHLNAFVRWGKVKVDVDDIMLVDDERTYELIDRMFSTLSKCFKSRKLHLGMDEAYMLGRGKHLDIHGYENSTEIMKRHLAKVNDIAKKYGYKTMLWSDMFFRNWNGGVYYSKRCEIPEEVKGAIPENVSPVYWDYYATNEERYDDMLYIHKQMSDDVWFAGGAWCWAGIIPLNGFSLKTMLPAMRACQKNKVKNVIMTLWGDDGGECSHFAQLPALLHIIEYAKGNDNEDLIKAKFKRMFGISYDDFMKIDLPNAIFECEASQNPSKYMLYSDPFLGFLDYTVSEGSGTKFAEISKELETIAKTTRKYGYVFKTAAKLCDVLEYKYELGVNTRKAYKENDKESLAELVKIYAETAKRVAVLHKVFSEQWHRDNKPHGFDVQDRRLGGLITRLESCKNKLSAYLAGKIEKIEELEEEVLPYGKIQGRPVSCNKYSTYASVNVISH